MQSKRRSGQLDGVEIWGYKPVKSHSGDTTPCRMTGVTLHGVVSPDETTVRTRWNQHAVSADANPLLPSVVLITCYYYCSSPAG